MQKQQVIFITWATPKENYSSYYHYLEKKIKYNPYEPPFLNWNKKLWEYLWEDFEYLRSPSCNEKFADYEAWKILFEKMFPYLREDVIIATTSLGSTFIIKYLYENKLPVKIKRLIMVAAALRPTEQERLGTFALDTDKIPMIASQMGDLICYHSTDDDCVPFSDFLKLQEYFPEATFREFNDRWHFFLEERLPEIEEDIKKA